MRFAQCMSLRAGSALSMLGMAGVLLCGTALCADDIDAHNPPEIEQTGAASVNDHPIKVDEIEPGTSARKIRDDALATLPLHRLSPTARGQVNAILADVGLFRRLPTLRTTMDPRIYHFFAAHPDVAVSIWRAMDVSQLQLYQTGPFEYETDAKDGGTLGVIHVLYNTPTERLVICDGAFKSPVVKTPIRAHSLLHLTTSFRPLGHGTSEVTHTAAMYVSFPSQTVETIARVVAPVSNVFADRNFHEVMLFAKMMDAAMSTRPQWIEQITTDLDGILPGRREELLKLTGEVYASARQRRMQPGLIQPAARQATLPEIIPPQYRAVR